jgi:LmbE family N-acetylglucosaminyl deacetylase
MNSSARTLLAVFAHPDDESFGTGGTLALYASRGVAVHVLCATRGEVGSVPEGMLQGYASVADLRETELRCASLHLGLAGLHFLGYRDSGMRGSPDNHHPQALVRAPLEKVASDITLWIRRLRPQVVITFDPVGGYHHPDHIAIHHATVRAFADAADPRVQADGLPPFQAEKLYFSTFPRRSLKLLLPILRLLGRGTLFGKNRDIDLAQIAGEDFPVHAHINIRTVAARKRLASACHASQQMPIRGFTRFWMWMSEGGETFMRGYPAPPPRLHERDLFDGVAG